MMGATTGESLEKIKAFPRVDDGFVALVGLSHAAYLAAKSSPLWLTGQGKDGGNRAVLPELSDADKGKTG
jgi:hypothetical protein